MRKVTSLEDVQEICADGTYFMNNLCTNCFSTAAVIARMFLSCMLNDIACLVTPCIHFDIAD